MKWIFSLLDRICAVVGALAFSQVPEFIQQYLQRLGGHVAELNHQIQIITYNAAASGKNLDQYIHKFKMSGDIDFVHQGEMMQEMALRYQTLLHNLQEIQQATAWGRGIKFFYHIDFIIARETMHHFVPGVSFSLEGMVYGLVGLMFGWMLISNLRKAMSLLKKRKRMRLHPPL